MTDLIDSLLEFARTRESLNPVFANVVETVQHAMQAVRLHPRHQGTAIEVDSNGHSSAWFDPRKLQRALYNLLLNACEAAPGVDGRVQVTIGTNGNCLTIEVADNGPGIAEAIRDQLFHPFVSYGKANGTGLGLTVVQKIVQDHGGAVVMERTADARTIFRITIPGQDSGMVDDASPKGRTFAPVSSAPLTNAALRTDRATENSIRHSDT
jgi:signal transduction histidine kinase